MEISMENNKWKVIVFDLDGTLYEDTHHFEYYAKQLQHKLPAEKHESFWKDYQSALDLKHALQIGRVYDVEHDLVLVHEHNRVQEVYSWDGSPLTNVNISDLYPDPIVIEQLKMLSIGDLWWLPAAIAKHYGISAKRSKEAFLETRSYMMSSEFVMKPVNGFKEALWSLKEKGFKLALLTNSLEKDSEAILFKLGLEHLFDKKIFEGQKPTHTVERFNELKEHFQVEYSDIVSIGDNWINEILPAAELGCSTILIDPHEISTKSFANHVVRNTTALIPLLKSSQFL
jgi:FMN phosphatase YigB (HAD superfamily)